MGIGFQTKSKSKKCTCWLNGCYHSTDKGLHCKKKKKEILNCIEKYRVLWTYWTTSYQCTHHIHWHLLKLSSGNENTDRWMDGQTDSQRDTIIPHHYHVAGYKNGRQFSNYTRESYGSCTIHILSCPLCLLFSSGIPMYTYHYTWMWRDMTLD